MDRINIFEQYSPDVTAFFSQKPDRTAELIPRLAHELGEGEYMIKPWMIHGKHIQVVDDVFLKGPHVEIDGYPANGDVKNYIEVPDTDGMVTDLPGVILATTHGDCLPVFAYDPVKKSAGVAHAGWKGTMIGIAGELVSVMKSEYGCDPRDILTYIGPGIDKCCFEVTDEVKVQFENEQPWMADFIRKKDDTHSLIDLKGINRRYLEEQGIVNIEISPDCTCCTPEKYWSYRRSHDSDRMLAYIKLNGSREQ